MAGEKTLGSIIVRIVGQNAEFDDAIDKSEKKLGKFSQTASQVGGNLTKFITLPLVGIGVAAVKSAADMEQAQLSFETLLGSGEKAKVLLGQLQKFASTTPFEFKDLAQGAKTLLAFGVDAQKILPITKQLGDVALGDSEKFKSLALVFGQISSTGHLMGQDLLQLINVGFNPLQEIAKHTGESMDELKKRMEKGGISANEVAAAFKSATSEGGRFFEGTQKLGGSFTGLVSTLKDDATTLARGFGELVLPTLKELVSAVSGVFQELNNLDPSTKQFIVQLGLTVAAIGPVISIVGKLSQALQFLGKNPILIVIGALVALTEAVVFLSKAEERQIQQWDKQIEKLKEIRGETEAIIGPVNDLTENQKLSADQIASLIKLYPELTNLVKLNNTTVAEAAKLAEDANKKRAVQGFNDTLKVIGETRAELEKYNKVISDNDKGVTHLAKSAYDQFKTKAEELTTKLNGLTIQNGQFKAAIDESNASWFKGPFVKGGEAPVKAVSDEIGVMTKTVIPEANAGFAALSAQMHAMHLQQQADIEQTAAERTEDTLNANAGFKAQSDEIAAGFAERSIAAKQSADAQVAEQDKVKKKTEQVLGDLKTAYSLTFGAIEGLVGAVFDFQMASYDKDSEEYKKAAHDKAVAQKVFSIAQIAVSTAEGVAKAIALVDLFPFNFVLAGIVGVAGLAQAAIVAATPIPDLAEGGIVPATTGGRLVNVAEAGQAEVIAPLDKLGEMLDNRGFGGGASASGGDIPVSLTIQLDRETWYSGIFQATRNRTVLISAGAVVN